MLCFNRMRGHSSVRSVPSLVTLLVLGSIFISNASQSCESILDPEAASESGDTGRYTVLLMPHGASLSHTTRTLMIARSLRARGHKAVFASDGRYMRFPTEDGFAVHSLPTLTDEEVEAVDRSGNANYYTKDQALEHAEAELALIREVGADAVISDFRPTVATAAELAGVPHIAILNAAWTHHYSGHMIIPEHFPGGRWASPFSKWLNRRPWTRRIAQRGLQLVTNSVLRDGVEAHNQARAELGLSRESDLYTLWEGDLTLLPDLPAFSPTHPLPENVRYVGPLTWSPSEASIPDWIEDLDRDRPIIYVTMGSTGDPKYLHEAIEAFGDTQYQLVITTADLDEFPEPPRNVYIASYAPGDLLMEMADVVVCAGGNGTVYQAIQAGTPIVGVPMHHDQEIFNMYPVEQLGIGVAVSDVRYRSGDLTQAVRRVMDDLERFQENMRAIRARSGGFTGAETAVDEIEEFLRERLARPSSAAP